MQTVQEVTSRFPPLGSRSVQSARRRQENVRAADARRAARTTWRARAGTAGPALGAHSKRPGRPEGPGPVGSRGERGPKASGVPACAPQPSAGKPASVHARLASSPRRLLAAFSPLLGRRSRWPGCRVLGLGCRELALTLAPYLRCKPETCQRTGRARANLAPAEKSAPRPPGPGCLSLRLNLSPGSWQQRRHGAPGAGPPRAPQSSASFADNSFVRGSLHPPPPGCGRAAVDSGAARLPGAVETGARGGSAREGAGAGMRSRGRRCRRGFCTWRGGPSRNTGLVTFLPVPDLQAQGSQVPNSGFLVVGQRRRRPEIPNPTKVCGLNCLKCLLGYPPPSSSFHPWTWGTMRVLQDGALELSESRGLTCSVPRPRTPPDARLVHSDRPGSLTRTVLGTAMNKEKLFAAFDEWDSASYRPHSGSSVR